MLQRRRRSAARLLDHDLTELAPAEGDFERGGRRHEGRLLYDERPPPYEPPGLLPIFDLAPAPAHEEPDQTGPQPRLALVFVSGDANVAGDDDPRAGGTELRDPLDVGDVWRKAFSQVGDGVL